MLLFVGVALCGAGASFGGVCAGVRAKHIMAVLPPQAGNGFQMSISLLPLGWTDAVFVAGTA